MSHQQLGNGSTGSLTEFMAQALPRIKVAEHMTCTPEDDHDNHPTSVEHWSGTALGKEARERFGQDDVKVTYTPVNTISAYTSYFH